jgi:hypothetical protein
MPSHKFHIGETVQLLPPISRHASGGVYVVTKKLPESAGEYGEITYLSPSAILRPRLAPASRSSPAGAG